MESVSHLCNSTMHKSSTSSQSKSTCKKCGTNINAKRHLEQFSVHVMDILNSVNENTLKAEKELEEGRQKFHAIYKSLFLECHKAMGN